MDFLLTGSGTLARPVWGFGQRQATLTGRYPASRFFHAKLDSRNC